MNQTKNKPRELLRELACSAEIIGVSLGKMQPGVGQIILNLPIEQREILQQLKPEDNLNDIPFSIFYSRSSFQSR